MSLAWTAQRRRSSVAVVHIARLGATGMATSGAMSRSTPFHASSLYEDIGLSSITSAAVVVPLVISWLGPVSVVDFGSGTGAWLEAFVKAGVKDIRGLEAGAPAPSQLRIPVEAVSRVDLEEPVDLGRRFDLAVSVEVAEHLPAQSGQVLVASLARHSDAVLFSAAVPGQGGTHHINEQWPTYWAEQFAGHGFGCFDVLRERVWDNSDVAWWYQQNLLIFARGESRARLEAFGLTASAPRRLVHPDVLTQRSGEGIGIREHLKWLLTKTVQRTRGGLGV